MHSHFRFSLAAVASALLAVSATAQQQQASPVNALGVDTTNFDRAIRPQDDFFRFVNGSWLEHTQIPADASSWGAFNELTEKSPAAIHQIVEGAAKAKAPPGSEERKVGGLYGADTGAAARIVSLETQIATPQWDRAKTRNRDLTYNKFSRVQLGAATPAYDWNAYLTAAGLSKAGDVIVNQPDYVKAMNDVIANTPVST